MADLSKIFLFRMTHVDNVLHIMEHGITHINSANCNKNYKPIGDGSLINNRTNFELPNGKKLGMYTPFYFGGRMPMLYVIQNGYNGVTKNNAEDIVYCVSTIALIQKHQLEFVFSNGHSINNFSEFFEEELVNDINEIVDFSAINEPFWKKDGDLDLKRRKEAEFLVNGDIPYEAIGIFIVYNEEAKQKLLAMKVAENKIKVNKNYYF